MFTLDQIKVTHSKVRSGGDFRAFINQIKQLGVSAYKTFVADGHTDYFGKNDYKASSPAKYDKFEIADQGHKCEFIRGLKEHQRVKTDYLTFCAVSAKTGIECWIGDTIQTACTYHDKAGNEMLLERLPQY